nr:MAG TPA: hypothetical protein [Bacteriophage sp.]
MSYCQTSCYSLLVLFFRNLNKCAIKFTTISLRISNAVCYCAIINTKLSSSLSFGWIIFNIFGKYYFDIKSSWPIFIISISTIKAF